MCLLLYSLIRTNASLFPRYSSRDIFTALTNGHVCTCLKELIVNHVRSKCPDVEVIVGLESRGFLFSFTIAAELGIGCVPVRKKGKLPGECVSVEYDLEYGKVSALLKLNCELMCQHFSRVTIVQALCNH